MTPRYTTQYETMAPENGIGVPHNSDGRTKIYLHIGVPKTGTTYLQDLMWHNRAALRSAGLLYPGLSSDAQFRAAVDVGGTPFQHHDDPAVPGSWHRFIEQARAWPGSVVMSHELFTQFDDAAVDRVHTDLAWADLHVVCTARDLARQVPAVWQEDVKNRHTLSFAEFATELVAPEAAAHPLAGIFWQFQDVPAVMRRWARALPPSRLSVVTVPPRSAPAATLWSRFAATVGLDAELPVEAPESAHNRSMGVAETNLVRRLNMVLTDELGWPDYDVLVKHELARSILGGRPGSVPLALPDSDHHWVADHSARMVAGIRDSGWRIVGDPDDLVPDRSPADTRHPDHGDSEEMLDAAVHAIAGLLEVLARRPDPARTGWRAAVLGQGRRSAAVRELHRRYLTVKARRSVRGG